MSPVLRTLRPIALFGRLVVPPLILAAGLWAGWGLFNSRPAADVVAADELPTIVRVVDVPANDTTIDVVAWGTVKASRTLSLHPEVAGRLVEVSTAFVPGGVFEVGDVIASIDRRDYEHALRQAESGLETARFNLEVEEGRGRVAQRDWEVLGDELDGAGDGSRMALREPHLAEKQAAVESAASRVEQARLSLERTTITAPFNAMVQAESAEVGQIVSSATTLGSLVGTDEYWVEIGVSLEDVSALDIRRGRARPATVTLATGGGNGVTYDGLIAGLTGSVDGVGRLARVLVTVPKPLEQSAERSLPLLLGSYVQVTLEGPLVRDVRRLPRGVVREGDQVWLAGADDRLAFRDIEVVGGDAEFVLAHVDLAPDERIISSPIPAAAPGMLLKREVAR